ncbi:hypothetical protein RXV86_21970 [Alisedimentitalea sp. MJ-SS2]|uniref:hypothetical protein n=1 Tax=Aliisedimentitalea sp. MJ-SS2 TaxID=3049795 RepID=UPI00290874F3|nr:hypothetical protein [Alisedimentitalea sp. MJ-SS2]MDU8930063.1 hypothetical protein [Alisedimentitalea sp. MJ-SS2]
MTHSPRFFRTTTGVAGVGLLIAATYATTQSPASLPTGRDIAVYFGQPIGAQPQRQAEPETLPEARARHVEPARIHARSAAKTAAESSSSSDAPNLSSADDPVLEALKSALDAASDEVSPSNVGDSEGDNYGLPDLGPLTPAIANRLITSGAGVVVAQLGDGRHLMLSPGPDGSLRTGQVSDWSEASSGYSRWELRLTTHTDVVSLPLLQTLVRREAGAHTLSKLSIVLSIGAEQHLIEAQKSLIANAGLDYSQLLAGETSVVTAGCWQARGALFRLNSLKVNGQTRFREQDPGCL